MKNHEHKKRSEKTEKRRFYGENKLFS
jgi:hypothetical protein